mgnify:CR=1 FL=1
MAEDIREWLSVAEIRWYGARIARGLKEPDIHGTCLFLWGIAVMAPLLGYGDLGFQEHDA